MVRNSNPETFQNRYTQKELENLFYDLSTGPKINVKRQKTRQLKDLPILTIDNEVYFPYLPIAIELSYEEQINSIKTAISEGSPIFITSVSHTTFFDTNISIDEVKDFVGRSGTVGLIRRTSTHPDGTLEVEILCGFQAKLLSAYPAYLTNEETNNEDMASVPYLYRGNVIEEVIQFSNVSQTYLETSDEIIKDLFLEVSKYISEEQKNNLNSVLKSSREQLPAGVERIFSIEMQNSPLTYEEKYKLLTTLSFTRRRELFIEFLNKAIERLKLRFEITQRTNHKFDQNNREEFLRAQIQSIKEELGEDSDDDSELRKRASNKEWDESTRKFFIKELNKLSRYAPNSPEYAIQYSYLDTFLNLPWKHLSRSQIDIQKVEEVLDRDHFGMRKVKDRIIEQMAVLKLKDDLKAPILCLYGPPGVGKTSLGKSIAEALGREYARIALGGVHDEAEIRGHRRTYLGAMPGRIISSLEKVGTSDPVIVLDEIDKLGKDIKGDPSMALLEVLDPAQNSTFHDNYIDSDYDLSKVLFIATANDISCISQPLLDRMELIEVGSYADEEKLQIALRHLLTKCLQANGFKTNEIEFSPEAIKKLITEYTHESGVRTLEKRISEVLRKEARLKASGKEYHTRIEPAIIEALLGKPSRIYEVYEGNDIPGVVTGLAWTPAGGEILYIESSISEAKGEKLILTGNLGDVMKESATIALQYLKANCKKIGISPDTFKDKTIHIHVPEGAVPKDGPSAGIAMLTSLASSLTGKKVAYSIAMTGEFSLRGRILPVGGVKEKVLAAKKAGIETIILSSRNKKDIQEIEPLFLQGLEFKFVDTADEVLSIALE